MDSPQTAPPATPRRRRQTFQCKECDEVFIDEESLRRHELTHKPAEPEPAAPPPAEPAPTPSPRRRGAAAAAAAAEAQQAEAASAVQESPSRRASSSVSEPSVEMPEGGFTPSPFGGGEVDPTMVGLGPMDWEQPANRKPMGTAIYGFLEDFSEWFFRGLQGGLQFFGLSLASGVGLAVRGLILLAVGAGLVFAGMYVGKKYGPSVLGIQQEPPLIPRPRVIPATQNDVTRLARQAVTDFYTALDNRSFSIAYNALSPSWQRELSFEEFERGYRNTQSIRCDIRDARKINDKKIELDVDLEVMEGGKRYNYQGVYQAIKTNTGWKLDSGKITQRKN